MGAAAVAGPHQTVGERLHQRQRVRQTVAVGEDELRGVAEVLHDGEQVVPAGGLEAGAVIAQLPEDLLHVERGRDRLDVDSRPDRALRDAHLVLRPDEDLVPQPSLERGFELGQVEVGSRAAVDEVLGVVEEVEPEVDECADRRHLLTV